MSPSFDLGEVDAFTAGTVGAPGQRIFYLQARGAGEVVTVKCEKQQVAALGQYLERLLQDLPAPVDDPLPTALELLDPVEAVWIAGQLGVAWDADLDRFVVLVEEMGEQPDDEESEEERDDAALDLGHVRVELTRGQALAFAGRAAELVTSGRPVCRFCGLPMDPDGHPCPRMN
ncbi:MAG TPA: DUF3090 family protein [Acidimicrobiales bacterium]|nr:DUF3090 family protein [Acidimicrobiales bacterium]